MAKVWSFYYFQGEEGESEDTPNAFQAKFSISDRNNLRFGEYLQSFPPMLYGSGKYHFRFRTNDPDYGYVWQDIIDPNTPLPVSENNIIFAKVLRTDMLPSMRTAAAASQWTRLRRKPVVNPDQRRGRRSSKEHEPIDNSATRAAAAAAALPAHHHHQRRRRSSHEPAGPLTNGGMAARPAPAPVSDKGSRNCGSGGGLTQPRPNKSEPDLLSAGAAAAAAAAAAPESLLDLDGAAAPPPPPTLQFTTAAKPLPRAAAAAAHHGGPAAAAAAAGAGKPKQPTMSATQLAAARHRAAAAARSSSPARAAAAAAAASGGPATNVVDGDDCPQALAEAAAREGIKGVRIGDRNYVGKSAAAVAGMQQRERDLADKTAQALQEKRQRDQAASDKASAYAAAAARHGARLTAWAEDHGKKRALRALLASLHTVLWPGARWRAVGLGDLLQPPAVRRAYLRSMMVVHEDKVVDLPPEHQYIANRACEGLTEAYKIFTEAELS